MDLYVYYRVRCEQEQTLQVRVTGMQQTLANSRGVKAALKRRPEPENGWHTWMEVYLDAPSDFEKDLASAAAEAKLDTLIDGVRHIDVFADISSCA